MWEGCSTCTFLGHVPRDSFIINLQKDSEICAYNKHSWPFFMKMGVLGHHLGISWHGINLFPPHCFQSLNLLQLSTPWKLQHTRLSCPSPSPRVCSNTCPLSQWCYLTISSSVFPSIRVFFSITLHHFKCDQERRRVFPGGPVIKPPSFQCRGHWFNPWSGN